MNDWQQGTPVPTRIIRVLLTDDWYACDGANGTIQGYARKDNSTDIRLTDTLEPVWLYDPDGIINGEKLAVADDDDQSLYLPAGLVCKVYQPEDVVDGHWELLTAGVTCNEEYGSKGNSSTEEGSQEEGSQEVGSQEEGSGEVGSGEVGSQELPSGSGCTPVPSSVMGLPIETNPDYVLGMKNGCYVLVPLGCGGSGSGS